MTGILFDRTTGVWNVFVDRPQDQLCAGCALQPDQALQILEQALRRAMTTPETGQSALESDQAASERGRQVRVRAIRRFFGLAAALGLDTTAHNPMRNALSDFVGRPLSSRKQLTTLEWMVCGNAVQSGVLFW